MNYELWIMNFWVLGIRFWIIAFSPFTTHYSSLTSSILELPLS
jgi:hypothetical protein